MDTDDMQEALQVLAQAEAMHRQWNDTPPDSVINIEPLAEADESPTATLDSSSKTSGIDIAVVEAVVTNHSSENKAKTLGTFKPIGSAMADGGDSAPEEGGGQVVVKIVTDGEEIPVGVIKTEDTTDNDDNGGAGDAAIVGTKRYKAGGSTALTPSVGAPAPTEIPAQKPKAANTPHGDKTCTVCGRILSSATSCQSHIANHGKEDFVMKMCDVCGWAFESQMQLKMHKKTHGSGGVKKALETGETLKVSFPFKKGPVAGKAAPSVLDKDPGNKLTSLACLFCGRVLHTREALKDHQNNHCNDFNFMQCPDCEMCFETKDPLVKHRKQAHNYHGSSDAVQRLHDAYVSFNCEFCQRSFKTQGKLEEHTENHKKGMKMVKCNICKWDFEGPGDLNIHKRNKHKDGSSSSGAASYAGGASKLPCTECGRLFKTEGAMQDHLENHYNDTKLYVCDDCGFAYENAGSYHQHKREKHKTAGAAGARKPRPKIEARTCDICKRVLPNLTAKEAHGVNHANGISMTKCDTCGWEFEVEEEYCQHVETAHKKKEKKEKVISERGAKHQCGFCDRKFSSETVLALHMQNHLTGVPMTKCEHCKAQFEKEAELEFHQKTHKKGGGDKKSHKKKTDEEETVCSQCDRQFYYESQMKTHLENHFNGSQLYKCKHCPWEYEKETSLTNHVKQYHPFYADIPEFAPPKKGGRKSTGEKFHCVMCKRVFFSLLNYAQHLVHHEKIPYKCPYDNCGWAFEDEKHFQQHRAKVHSETSDDLKYRLEKIAQEQAKKDGGEVSKEDERIQKDAANPKTSVSFSLVCPRCRDSSFDKRTKLEVHASRCKVDYHCNLCDLEFKSLYEFEYHIYPEQMECEACKKRFGSECILQTHLMKVHFSEDMIDEQQKQQELLEEAKRKAEEKAAAAKPKKKAKTEPTATVVKKSTETKEVKVSPKRAKLEPKEEKQEEEETPKATRGRGRPSKGGPKKKVETPPTRTLSPRKAKSTPSSTVTKSEVQEKDAVSDEHLVSSTVDTPDGSTAAAPAARKRKRAMSNDSNTVDSSDDPKDTQPKKQFSEGAGDSNASQDTGFVCDVEPCGGTFFKVAKYMQHVRDIHADVSNITSNDTCSIIMLKDTRRTRPLQRGPASKRKEFSILRVQCLQGACAEEDSFFTTRALYNKHAAEAHTQKGATNGEAKSGKSAKDQEAVVQSTVSSPGSNKADEPEESEDESKTKKSKKDDLQSMISKSSFTTLLKDLEIDKKNTRSKKRGGSPARTSPRARRSASGTKGGDCEVCRKKFGSKVSECLCDQADGIHMSDAKVELKSLSKSVVKQV